MIFAPMTPTLSLPSQDLQFLDMFEQICNQLEKRPAIAQLIAKDHSRNHVLPEHGSRIPKSCHFWWISDVVSCIICPSLAPKIDIRKKTSRAWRDSAQCQNEMTHLRFGRVWWIWMALLRHWGWVNDSNSVLYTCYRSCTKDLWNHHFKNISSPRSMNKHHESKQMAITTPKYVLARGYHKPHITILLYTSASFTT